MNHTSLKGGVNMGGNECFCKCHESGKSQCPACKRLHRADEPAATHPNDPSNPNLPTN